MVLFFVAGTDVVLQGYSCFKVAVMENQRSFLLMYFEFFNIPAANLLYNYLNLLDNKL